ncbi:hypothetical protein BDM02DRAFT_314835 [Thelephora ganbajun]|uniref:Uncharacterized protein n=1 Tax=Thelephora ganbajun TaxID=370292 RepID=A0ACB6Z8X5_THEGA|nr:hypothetical protein BDM02DRAFT_314835 [Thelephora ganbajun]
METRLAAERYEKRKERASILGKSVLAFRRSNTTPRDFFPTLGAITNLPHVSEILDHGDDEAFEELTNGITEQLPGITCQIRKEREETLLKLLPPGYTSPEPLKLATTWFTSRAVLKTARMENVINELWGLAAMGEWDRISVNGGVRWSTVASRIAFEERVMAVVTKLITDSGVGDPKEMTAEELDNVPCRVVIFSKDPKKPVLSMEVGSWRHLVQKVACSGLETIDWRVLEGNELPDVTSVGQPPVDELWDCVHCWRAETDYGPQEPHQARDHLLEAHSVEDPVEDADYWIEAANGGINFNRQPEERNQSPSPIPTLSEVG